MGIYLIFYLFLTGGVPLFFVPLAMAVVYIFGYDRDVLFQYPFLFLYFIVLALVAYLTLRMMPSFFLLRVEKFNNNKKEKGKIISYIHDLKIGFFATFFIFLIPLFFIFGKISAFSFELFFELFPEFHAGLDESQIRSNYRVFAMLSPPLAVYFALRLCPMLFIDQLKEWSEVRRNNLSRLRNFFSYKKK